MCLFSQSSSGLWESAFTSAKFSCTDHSGHLDNSLTIHQLICIIASRIQPSTTSSHSSNWFKSSGAPCSWKKPSTTLYQLLLFNGTTRTEATVETLLIRWFANTWVVSLLVPSWMHFSESPTSFSIRWFLTFQILNQTYASNALIHSQDSLIWPDQTRLPWFIYQEFLSVIQLDTVNIWLLDRTYAPNS